MIVKLLTEHHLEFLSPKGGCIGSSESTLVKIQHCWKSGVAAHIVLTSYRVLAVFYDSIAGAGQQHALIQKVLSKGGPTLIMFFFFFT